MKRFLLMLFALLIVAAAEAAPRLIGTSDFIFKK
jgi:hypothetical protein